MNSKFDELVQTLDPATLEELRRSVVVELGGRRQQNALRIEDIHPRMSGEEKERAALEIARVLRGEDLNA